MSVDPLPTPLPTQFVNTLALPSKELPPVIPPVPLLVPSVEPMFEPIELREYDLVKQNQMNIGSMPIVPSGIEVGSPLSLFENKLSGFQEASPPTFIPSGVLFNEEA